MAVTIPPFVWADELKREVKIHICKDGTFSTRRAGERVFNGRALAVYSVDTDEQAERLAIRFCREQYVEHPQLPGKSWYRVNEAMPTLEVEQLDQIALKFHEFYHSYLRGTE